MEIGDLVKTKQGVAGQYAIGVIVGWETVEFESQSDHLVRVVINGNTQRSHSFFAHQLELLQ